MSNEEIALRIQTGETELMEKLWEGVEKLIRKQANRVSHALGCRFGVEADDLYQTGYFAVVAAVDTYTADAGSFVNWLMFYLKTAFAEATGYRTVKGRRDPLRNSLSLDKPFEEEADSVVFGDLIPDPLAAATMEGVEEKLWRQQLQEAMESVLGELPEEQRTILKCRYYTGKTLTATGEQLGIPAEEVRKKEGQGLKALRHYKLAKKIRPFYDFDCYAGTGLGAFRNSGMSIQERYLIMQERRKEKQEAHIPE